MIPELRPFQLDVVNRVRDRMAAGRRRVILQAATGAGKTTCAAFIVRCAVALEKSVLFLAHRRRLIDQISSRLEEFEVDHGVLMRGHKYEKACRVQVGSKDTIVSRCIDNQWYGLPPADLIILDEGRHALSPEYQGLIRHYPDARLILLDATPVQPDGSGLAPFADAIECAAPTSELIRDGYLVPVKCFAPGLTSNRRRQGKITKGIAGDLVEAWRQHAGDMPTVVFASKVAHSRDAVLRFQAAGITAAHLDADTPDDVRDRVFDDVEDGRIKVISNVGILGEGVDIPCLGCCVLWCNVSSRVRFLQATGRIVRPFPGKKHGVLIDHAAAVWEHGFPDEDSLWTLCGNANEAFAEAKAKGETKQPHYCQQCELVYDGPECPQCGRPPGKKPRSIFASLPDERDEEVMECERSGERSQEAKVKHWLRCLGVAARRGGNFLMASAIWKQKYGEWPPQGFPCLPGWDDRRRPVAEIYPGFARSKR